MDKDLKRQLEVVGGLGAFHTRPGTSLSLWFLNFFNLLEGTLPCQHDQIASELESELDTGRAGDRHLGRDMNREIGRHLPNQAADTHILHDSSIHTRADGCA